MKWLYVSAVLMSLPENQQIDKPWSDRLVYVCSNTRKRKLKWTFSKCWVEDSIVFKFAKHKLQKLSQQLLDESLPIFQMFTDEGKKKGRSDTCSEVMLLASKGGASVIVRARNTGFREEKGTLT